jgi:hypothetical protein
MGFGMGKPWKTWGVKSRPGPIEVQVGLEFRTRFRR